MDTSLYVTHSNLSYFLIYHDEINVNQQNIYTMIMFVTNQIHACVFSQKLTPQVGQIHNFHATSNWKPCQENGTMLAEGTPGNEMHTNTYIPPYNGIGNFGVMSI